MGNNIFDLRDQYHQRMAALTIYLSECAMRGLVFGEGDFGGCLSVLRRTAEAYEIVDELCIYAESRFK